MLVQISGTNLYRDTETMALINKDVSGLEDYKMKRHLLSTQKEEINTVKTEIETMKNDINDIKNLMVKLLEKVN